jgi:hypothetical protein
LEIWQIELIKIGGTAIVAFVGGGLGGYWLYLRKRKIENAPDKEKLEEVEKLTNMLIQHRKHNISPIELSEFKDNILSRISQGEAEWRSKDDILEAEEEFFTKVWYGRHKLLEEMVKSGQTQVYSKTWEKALEAARKIEKRYGKKQLAEWSDFEWGMLNGKLSTLRWVSGSEWDMLDT